MSIELLRFGSICASCEGDLSVLRGTFFDRFFASEGTPAFCVRFDCAELGSAPSNAVLLHRTPSTEVFRTDAGFHRRFSAVFGGARREYAVCDYSDRCAALTIAPECTNIPACIEACTAFEHLILHAGGLPVHASFVRVSGQGIIFTAPSGVGKSTQAALWERYRSAEVMNGDKTLLVKTPQGFEAAGIPYAGTSGICYAGSAPLRAVVALEQAEGNAVIRLRGAAAVRRIFSGVIRLPWHTEDIERALTLAEQLAAAVPVYLLRCRPEESAVCALEYALCEKERENGGESAR